MLIFDTNTSLLSVVIKSVWHLFYGYSYKLQNIMFKCSWRSINDAYFSFLLLISFYIKSHVLRHLTFSLQFTTRSNVHSCIYSLTARLYSLTVRLPARLPACLPARLPSRLPTRLSACAACSSASLRCLLVCLLLCLLVCLLACSSICGHSTFTQSHLPESPNDSLHWEEKEDICSYACMQNMQINIKIKWLTR